jgi:peptidoglycan/LPS O-acetylase OafA/YrhL
LILPAGIAPASQRLDFLDGLRGWAALVVVFSHLWGQFARHVVPFYGTAPMRALSCGHLAVVVFFVLSGAALSLQFVRSSRPTPFVPALAARYVRLVVPIAGTTLIVWALLALGVAGNVEAARLGQSAIFLGVRLSMDSTLLDVVGFSLWDVLFRYAGWRTFNWSLWTMPVEFAGSAMIYALLAAFAHAKGLGRAARVALAVALAAVLLLAGKPLAACFAAGYVIAEWIVHPAASPRAARWAGLAALAACAGCAGFVIATSRDDDASAAFLAVGIVLVAAFWPPARRALGAPWSRWLGRVSFPLYLIHEPVIACMGFFFVALVHLGLDIPSSTHATVVAATVACLACGRLLMPLERASITLSRKVAQWRIELPWRHPRPTARGADVRTTLS